MLGSCIYANSEAFDVRVAPQPDMVREGLGQSPIYALYPTRDG